MKSQINSLIFLKVGFENVIKLKHLELHFSSFPAFTSIRNELASALITIIPKLLSLKTLTLWFLLFPVNMTPELERFKLLLQNISSLKSAKISRPWIEFQFDQE